MPNFKYKAINAAGATVTGVVTADSADLAENILTNQGYIPTEIADESASLKGGFLQRIQVSTSFITVRDLIIFTKQFRTMLVAGLPIVQTTQILEHQTENLKLRDAISQIGLSVKEGSTLHGAFARHPDIFSPLYLSMLQAGETSGNLPEVLNRLIYIMEHEHKVKSEIRSAMFYPVIVVFALFAAFIFLLTFVIPAFAKIYSKAGVELPLPTRLSLAMYHFLANYWIFIIIGIIAIILVFILYFRKTGQGKFVWHSLMLRVPLLGPLFVKVAMSRFSSIFAILQSSGIPVLTSLQILSGVIGNEAIAREFDKVKDRVEEGRGISAPLRSAKYFTPMVVDMVAVGEESGQLDEMLHQVSVHYDDEVEYAVRRLSDALGPLLIVGLAVVVGFFALAIFLPMWDLIKVQAKF